jgi:hypothetical protein
MERPSFTGINQPQNLKSSIANIPDLWLIFLNNCFKKTVVKLQILVNKFRELSKKAAI